MSPVCISLGGEKQRKQKDLGTCLSGCLAAGCRPPVGLGAGPQINGNQWKSIEISGNQWKSMETRQPCSVSAGQAEGDVYKLRDALLAAVKDFAWDQESLRRHRVFVFQCRNTNPQCPSSKTSPSCAQTSLDLHIGIRCAYGRNNKMVPRMSFPKCPSEMLFQCKFIELIC